QGTGGNRHRFGQHPLAAGFPPFPGARRNRDRRHPELFLRLSHPGRRTDVGNDRSPLDQGTSDPFALKVEKTEKPFPPNARKRPRPTLQSTLNTILPIFRFASIRRWASFTDSQGKTWSITGFSRPSRKRGRAKRAKSSVNRIL